MNQNPPTSAHVPMLEMMSALCARKPEFFALLDRFIAQHHGALTEFSQYIPWQDHAVGCFLLAGIRQPAAATYFITHIVQQCHGNAIYHLFRGLPQPTHAFLSTSPTLIQLLFVPYYAFDYAEKNITTHKDKGNKHFTLKDFNIEDPANQTILLIFALLKNLMLPYQDERLGRSVAESSQQSLEAAAELMTLLFPREQEYTSEELAAVFSTLPLTIKLFYSRFDQFLEFLRDNMQQHENTAYYHHLLWFLDRSALFHDTKISTIAHDIAMVIKYFERKTASTQRIVLDKIHPDLLLLQQLYFCHLLLMGSHFSDKKLMYSNIRKHVDRIRVCQQGSPLYKHISKQRLHRQRVHFDFLFQQLIERIHGQASLFIAESMNCQNTLLRHFPKISRSDNSNVAAEIVPSTQQIMASYLHFMQNLLLNLTPAEQDTLLYNPDYCLALYHGHLLKKVEFSNLPGLSKVDNALLSPDLSNTETRANQLDDMTREKLSVKCYLYAVNYSAIVIALNANTTLTSDTIFLKIVSPHSLEAAYSTYFDHEATQADSQHTSSASTHGSSASTVVLTGVGDNPATPHRTDATTAHSNASQLIHPGPVVSSTKR